MFKDFEKKGPETLSDYREFEFENGVRLISRILKDEPSFRFIDKDGNDLVDLASFVPAGTRLEINRRKGEEGKWGADSDDEGPVLLVGDYSDGSEALVSFLHEAGHLQNIVDFEIRSQAKRKHFLEAKKDIVNAYPNSRLLAMKEEKDIVMKSERDAWAFALRKVREIEKKFNISIFERLGSRGAAYERARNFTNEYLGTYERGYLEELESLDIFGEKQMEEFFASLEEEANA